MIAGAILPALLAVGAGVFGRLPAIVFWIVVVALVWFSVGCGVIFGIVAMFRRPVSRFLAKWQGRVAKRTELESTPVSE